MTSVLAKSQKMDTVHFWKIMDYGFEKGKFDNKIKEQAILEQLIKLTPEQIQEFEIIFQQMNKKIKHLGEPCSTNSYRRRFVRRPFLLFPLLAHFVRTKAF